MTQEFERKINIKEIEKKWQKRWNEARIFESDPDKREKYYINFPFPYINGAPHLGHGYSLLKAEAMARYQRMLGKNVLFPFAFHATGEPIAGIAKRVRAGDKIQIKSLIKSGIPKDEIDKFTDSMNIINFFRKQWTNTVQSLGTAIDWRRQFVTTQLTPTFSKFIEWQYNKLKEDGFVVQGSHPVVWCPADQNPTGDHDRLEGEGARVVDFIMLKFKSTKHDAYLLPATLRPETIFGVTNIFLHPKAQYIKMKINDINYIVAKDTLIKFQDQKFDVEDIMDIDIKDLIGENAINPITNQEVLILPGDFIDTAGSTGVVMSVPAHAPMDWITLQDLKNSPSQLEAWGISEEMITSIQPISLIELEGYGEFPAKEGLDSFNVTSKSDPNVKEATKQIYKKEFNSGKLRSITGKYAGMSIVEVKDQITSDLIDNNIAMKLKEPGEVVICRCGTRNHVKFLENQWFLNFSDEKWKKKTYDLIKEMDFYPPEARKAFENTIDWLEDKACARKSGLGTPLPWDNDWIVETLSDSVIYMAYYIVSKYVNSGEFKIEYATKEIFDYIMLGKGKVVELVESTGIDKKLLSNIRKDLQYFYGFDLRTSGKDLMNNHLSFMLMHHTAIFPKSFHPKAIAVNGYVAIIKPGSLKAQKMSKSKGNFDTIEDTIEGFGVDATRIGFLIAGEGLKDAQFSLEEGESYNKWLEVLYNQSMDTEDDNHLYQIDKWLYSRIQSQIQKTRNHLDKMETRSAFQAAYHEIQQDIKWYLRRRQSKGPAYIHAIEKMILMISPFAPHLIEEIWEMKGNKGFASNELFPEPDSALIHTEYENAEKNLKSTIDDIRGLKTFLIEKGGTEPKTIHIYVAPKWMYDIYNDAFENGLKNLIGRVMQDPNIKKVGKAASAYSQKLMKQGIPPDFAWSRDTEYNSLVEAKNYLKLEFNAEIEIIHAEESTEAKAKASIPRRPGINFTY